MAALFGVLKIGAVVVMVNPDLKPDAIEYFYRYTGAALALIHDDTANAFVEAAGGLHTPQRILVVGGDELQDYLDQASPELESFPTHPDDPAIWLFSGGTTGQPKAVVQPHRSFANTTECYAKKHLAYSEDDITLSVPKLYFGYATGSNLLFPFSVGASAVLFPEGCVTEVLFEKIRRFRPTILINVPTMVNHMVSHEDAGTRDLSCLRLATSAGETPTTCSRSRGSGCHPRRWRTASCSILQWTTARSCVSWTPTGSRSPTRSSCERRTPRASPATPWPPSSNST